MKWESQEAGWYTSKKGGIVKERDGKWYFYQKNSYPVENNSRVLNPYSTKFGPYNTLKEAKEEVK